MATKKVTLLTRTIFVLVLAGHVQLSYQKDDPWIAFVLPSDMEHGHSCPTGDGEYPDPYFPSRFYSCQTVGPKDRQQSLMKKVYVCPLGLCYNSTHPFKCDKKACKSSTSIKSDPYICDKAGIHLLPKDPTGFYTCKENAKKTGFEFSGFERCVYASCGTESSYWPCGEGYPNCLK